MCFLWYTVKICVYWSIIVKFYWYSLWYNVIFPNSVGAFHQFDYGPDQNILKYGNIKPPDYDLSKVTAPVAIWYGLNDRLVYHEVRKIEEYLWFWVKLQETLFTSFLLSFQDVVALSKQLPNLVGLHLVPFPKFNHFDFLWAKDSQSLLYDHVIQVMSQF